MGLEGIKIQLEYMEMNEGAKLFRRKDGKKEKFCLIYKTEKGFSHRLLINGKYSKEINGLPPNIVLADCEYIKFYDLK